MGGHFTDPYEQKTQQSPGLGLSSVLQCPHWKKNWHASVGMMHGVFVPQLGQVKIDSSTTSVMALSPCFYMNHGTASMSSESTAMTQKTIFWPRLQLSQSALRQNIL